MGPRRHRFVLIFIESIIFLFYVVKGFNIDLKSAQLYEGPPGSKFGMTVSHIRLTNGTKRLLVGAPEADTTQLGIREGGAVYACHILTHNNSCFQLPFDTEGNHKSTITIQEGHKLIRAKGTSEDKSYQWFGATLVTAQTQPRVLACAPRYVFHTNYLFTYKFHVRYPIGQCILMNVDDYSVKRYRTCYEETKWDNRVHGEKVYCMSGMSAALNQDGSHLVIGEVGSFLFHGTVTSLNHGDSDGPDIPPPQSEINQTLYYGYSVAAGLFHSSVAGLAGPLDYAVGAPRSNDLLGGVVVFSEGLQQLHKLTGLQLGEYFGYSVAVADFNNDGLDDLVVGAPFYSEATIFDMGRACVFFQTSWNKLGNEDRQCLKGMKTKGARFGTALAGIGDINNDKYNDLAVGAPYDGVDHAGVVYIFHGSITVFKFKPAQIIHARSIHRGLSGFGFSVSGNTDVDHNGYPDILVGAYNSDKAALMLTRPVVYVNQREIFQFEVTAVNLKEKTCQYQNTNVTCFPVTICFTTYDDYLVDIGFDYTLKVDTLKHGVKRANFYLNGSETLQPEVQGILTLKPNTTSVCENMLIFAGNRLRDMETPIGFQLDYKQANTSLPAGQLKPLLDQTVSPSIYTSIPIQRACGEDDVCVPDLTLNIHSATTNYTYGTELDLDITINLLNQGEDAYLCTLSMNIPNFVQYRGIKLIQGEMVPICDKLEINLLDMSSKYGHSEMKCETGNPYEQLENTTYILSLRIEKFDVPDKLSTIIFTIKANSSNVEDADTTSDNTASLHIQTLADVNIRMTGISEPEQGLTNATEFRKLQKQNKKGPSLKHIYEIRNRGPSSVSRILTIVRIPTVVDGDLTLMNFTSQPVIKMGLSEGNCSVTHQKIPKLPKGQSKRRKRHEVTSIDQNIGASSPEDDTIIKIPVTPDQVKDEGLPLPVNCSSPFVRVCTIIACNTSRMNKDDSSRLEIDIEIDTVSVSKVQGERRGLAIRSDSQAKVTVLPYVIQLETYPHVTLDLSMLVAGPKEKKVALWIILVSASCGLLILVLLIFGLYKCGFFQRNRVKDVKAEMRRKSALIQEVLAKAELESFSDLSSDEEVVGDLDEDDSDEISAEEEGPTDSQENKDTSRKSVHFEK